MDPSTSAARFTAWDFFAGSGLVTLGLQSHFSVVWANDICAHKRAVYTANHGDRHFQSGSITDVSGQNLPKAQLAWASFPCQDLSLAGNGGGIHARRSGLVWEWLRVIDESGKRRPPVLAIENVVGLVARNQARAYRELHRALTARGYRVGAMLLDAISWLPQSRPRVFIVAVDRTVRIPKHLIGPLEAWCRPASFLKHLDGLDSFIAWQMPVPAPRTTTFNDTVDWQAPADPPERCRRNLDMISPQHRLWLDAPHTALPGYRRTRQGTQVLELRNDGVAGCLRTPGGGSSRQIVVLCRKGSAATRFLTVREAARLMGVGDDYRIPVSDGHGYHAMGDAVAVPATRHLAQHLLHPLAMAAACQGAC